MEIQKIHYSFSMKSELIIQFILIFIDSGETGARGPQGARGKAGRNGAPGESFAIYLLNLNKTFN